ncbi:cytochrome P450 [Ophiobolus disseminans]|uniref:Cytochrome P450 n=1 Tax=Ophiobolus disseminans TaxID=1469910 RepID=A0A6A6ZDZ3_9PLEO|nr:cytochrome P450 [Ophiobolus disseminans]
MAIVSILLVLGAVFTLYVVYQQRRAAKLPPGPRRLPIIGNLHQAPTGAVWLKFQRWVEQYGPLVSLDFGGTSVILVGNYDIARDLLDKRASIYSSRPRSVFAGELATKNKHILFKPYNEEYLKHQRLEAPVMSPRASACYTPVQDLESKQMLKNFLSSDDYSAQFERFTASIQYTLAFGFRIVTGEEWQLKANHKVLENAVAAIEQGRWIVDALPFLNYLPACLAPWKNTGEEWYKLWDDLHMANMQGALDFDGWNWTKAMLHSKEAQQLTKEEIAWDVGVLCDGGVETTNMTLRIFTFACITCPEWIPKAQQELDAVVGNGRLPDFEDLENLPYLQAVVEENFRWRHIVPLGIPHATTQDDYYKGYLIPKGSTIIPLFLTMRGDTQLYDSPSEFRPERWIGKTGPNTFGYGRRVCPGRFIARNSVAIAFARLLWAFNIRSKDEEPPVMEESRFTTGFVSSPKQFEASFEPRSEKHRRVIEESFESAEKDTTKILNQIRDRQLSAGLEPMVH